jgi:hypothetical protein
VRFCATVDAAFCADFDDEAGSIDLGWSGYVEKGGGHVKRDGDRYSSAPSSLGATDPGDGGFALVSQAVPAKRSIVFEMDLSPRTIPSGSDPSSPLDVRISGGDGGPEQRFHFYVYAGAPASVQQWLGPGTYQDFPMAQSIPTDVWTHVRFEIDIADTRLRVTLDGTSVLDTTAAFVVPPGIFTVELGIPYASHTGPSKVNVDNFVVYAK